tara:strand:- start:219 stop:815 length:597 start_codon:yes stop_codon:yes gene_type:complete
MNKPEINTQYQILENSWAGNNPRSLMLHTTAGSSVIGAYETLKARGLSYNYLISNGKIYEIVPYDRCAWHAGVIRQPNMRSRVFYKTLTGEDNPNKHSVGIAFVQARGVTELPEEDIDAFVLLSKWIGQQTGYRYTADNIFYHKEVTSDKPWEVEGYRLQALDGLVGDKDDTDEVVEQKLKLIIKYLHLLITELRKKK